LIDEDQWIQDIIHPYKSILGKGTSRLLKNNFLKLSSLLTSALDVERKGFYPKFFLEQIISAFFCSKFTTQEHIWSYIRALPKNIVPFFPEHMNLIPYDQGDVDKIAQAQSPMSLEEMYLWANRDRIGAVVPYTEGASFVTNGACPMYSHITQTLDHKAFFADCTETAVRHMLTMVLFDPKKETYDISQLDKLEKQVPESLKNVHRLEPLKTFFKKQSLYYANSGDSQIRALWNRVSGDLNHSADRPDVWPTIVYAKENNDLRGGFLNILYAMSQVLGQPQAYAAFQGMEESQLVYLLPQAYSQLFSKLNERYEFKSWFETYYLIPEREDYFGRMHTSVRDGGKKIFSFDLLTNERHTQVDRLRTSRFLEVASQKLQYPENRLELLNNMNRNHIEQSFRVLYDDGPNHKMPFFYRLYSEPIRDLEDIKDVLNLLLALDWNHLDNYRQGLFLTIVENILRDLNWCKNEVIDLFSPTVRQVFQEAFVNAPLKKIFSQYVKGVRYGYSSSDTAFFRNSFRSFKNLVCLQCDDFPLEKMDLNGMVSLKYVDLSGQNLLRLTGLHTLKSLKSFRIAQASALLSVSFAPENVDLSTLILEDLSMGPLFGLEYLVNLKKLRKIY
jgi:hypothetical protein